MISRGIERREIFGDDSDRWDFLERLFSLRGSHGVVTHGYCLMDNHFHLQVETRSANLKEAMQRLLSGYVVRFNLRHRRVGPLFQGRYKAILAGEKEWITEVSRYVHLNPVRTERYDLGKARQAEVRRGIAEEIGSEDVKKRLEALRSYRWSSYRAYAGYQKAPELLEISEVLGCFEGETEAARRKAYRSYVEEAIREGEKGDDLLERVRYGVLLGSTEWTAKMRSALSGNEREQRHLRQAGSRNVNFEDIARCVAAEFNGKWEQLSCLRGHPARGMSILLSRRYTALKLAEIGEHCGGMDYAAVSDACKRMRKRAESDQALRKVIDRIENRIFNLET